MAGYKGDYSGAAALRLPQQKGKGRALRERTKGKPARTERLRRLYVADKMVRKQERSTLADRRDDVLFDFTELFGGRLVRLFDRGEKGFAFGACQRFVNLVGGLSAPAVGTECNKLFLIARESFEIGQKRCYRRHHIVVERRGTDGNVFGSHGVCDDVGIVAVMQVIKARFESAGKESVLNGMRHAFRGMPHCVIDDDRRIVVFVGDPGFVERENVGNMFCPADSVARADQIDLKICAGRQCFCGLHSVRLYDVRIVFARLNVCFRQIAVSIQTFVGSVMLTECVVGKQNVAGGHICYHVVRPMYHGGGYEMQGMFPQNKRFARLYPVVAEIAVVSGQVFDSCAESGVYFCIFRNFQNGRNTAAVIGFRMVGNNDIDFRRIDHGCYAGKHFAFEAFLDRIDQGDFFVENKISVVGRTFFRFVAVEIPEIPVNGAHPIDAFAELECFHIANSPFHYLYII